MLSLLASVLAPFFFELTPEVRTTYQSLGKIVEDRPMQITNLRFGWDSGMVGRFGVRNWDVSSLSDRRSDAHRHALYHTEWGPTWQYDWEIAEGWMLKSDLTRSWTMYRGFENDDSNKTYHFWQIDQSLENPYVVPFYRIRRAIRTMDYTYFKVGLRRRLDLGGGFSLTPSVFAEGGSGRNMLRVFSPKVDGTIWRSGIGSVSFRLELGWRYNEYLSLFTAIEQYEVVGDDARRANDRLAYRCAHNDWTHGTVGVRIKF